MKQKYSREDKKLFSKIKRLMYLYRYYSFLKKNEMMSLCVFTAALVMPFILFFRSSSIFSACVIIGSGFISQRFLFLFFKKYERGISYLVYHRNKKERDLMQLCLYVGMSGFNFFKYEKFLNFLTEKFEQRAADEALEKDEIKKIINNLSSN